MSPVAEAVTDKERAATSIVSLVHQIDHLVFENRQLSQENIALAEQLAELTEVFSLTEVADLLVEFNYQPLPQEPLTYTIYAFCRAQVGWFVGPTMTVTGGEYMRAIDGSGLVLTHKGRAFVFDAFIL